MSEWIHQSNQEESKNSSQTPIWQRFLKLSDSIKLLDVSSGEIYSKNNLKPFFNNGKEGAFFTVRDVETGNDIPIAHLRIVES